jgi:integrase/recombinase XerD
MPRKKRVPKPLGPFRFEGPGELARAAGEFLDWCRVRGYSEMTLSGWKLHLRYFLAWCHERQLFEPFEITRPILERYQRHLYLYRKRDGEPLGQKSQMVQLWTLRSFFRWLVRQGRLVNNPASELHMPRLERRLPREVLSAEQIERVLSQPSLKTPAGLRSRAILEVLYSTGMRRSEAAHLELGDIDLDRALVMVRQGKGKKDRLLPLGQRAAGWVRRYLEEGRPKLVDDPNEQALFLTSLGQSLRPVRLGDMVRAALRSAGIEVKGACHVFRHSCATLMLNNGADIRFIQELLGHESLGTTQIYTRVAIHKLAEVHAKTHPAELGRQEGEAPEPTGAGEPEAATDEAPPSGAEAEPS